MVEPLATSPLLPAHGVSRSAGALRAIETLARSGSPLAARGGTVRALAAASAPAGAAAWSLPAITAIDAITATAAHAGQDRGDAPLERLFPEGLPKGELVELVGRRSAGRLGVALALLAAATSAGENAALVDLGDGLDPQEGARHGIDLERLLWARPTHLKPALAAAESLLAGGFPFVVVELGLPPVAGGRGADAHWLRLARAARDTRALALVCSPYRVAGFAAPYVLELSGARARWHGRGLEPRLLSGVDARVDLVHGRSESAGGAAPDLARAPERRARLVS